MKPFLVCLLLILPGVTLAEGEISPFTFPPFAKEEMKIPTHPLPYPVSDEELNAISVEELRGIMATGGIADQDTAARVLMERGDQKTILRFIYSLKQGNVLMEALLSNLSSLKVVPNLMEDVAHGSLNNYGSYPLDDVVIGEGRVRVAVVKLVTSILSRAPELTGETGECVKAICRGRIDWVQGLSDQSRYLVQWWQLNETAFEAGNWEDLRPLPQEIIYLDPKYDTLLPAEDLRDNSQRPPFGSPEWELDEPFEVWAERIVDPKRRNLDFVALSWDGKKVVEHPAISLDPKAKPEDRETRKTLAPRNPPEPESGDGAMGRKGIVWITVTAVLMIVLSIVRWTRRKRVR